MLCVRSLITMIGIYATILVLSKLCVGQVKIDDDQTFTDGGYERRVNYACESSLLHAECEEGQVIRFLRGNYGRANTGTCYHDFTAEWYCRSNASEQIIRERCEKKRSCIIEASNEIFGNSCPNTVKYLDIQYYCVPGESESIDAPVIGTQSKEYERQIIYACESTQLHADCEEGKVINFLRARYGRSTSPTCHQDEWYCTANSTERIVRERCDQKRSCRVDVSNEGFGDPCPYNLKYLEFQFTCVPDPAISSLTTGPAEETPPTAVSEAPYIPTAATETHETTTTAGCDEYDLECLNFACPEGTGNFAHPTNKNMFIFCMNWRPRADACGEGLVFLERFMTCFSENSLFYFWLTSEENR